MAKKIASGSVSYEGQAETLALPVKKDPRFHHLSIGIPKEITFQENRVPLTPSAVQYFTSNGHQIKIETGAGRNANFSDSQYSEAGAELAYSPKEVYEADIVLKIDPPTLKEVELMRPGQLLVSALQINQLEESLLAHDGQAHQRHCL